MRATVDGTVIAEAPQSELVRIEGNWYFPPSAIAPGCPRARARRPTPARGRARPSTGTSSRPGGTTKDGAWSYPDLKPTAVEPGRHRLRRLRRLLPRGDGRRSDRRATRPGPGRARTGLWRARAASRVTVFARVDDRDSSCTARGHRCRPPAPH